MRAAFAGGIDTSGDALAAPAPRPRLVHAAEPAAASAERCIYGAGRGANWPALAAILAAHLLLLWALVALDVIEIRRTAKPPLVVTLIPDPIVPPPAPPVQPEAEIKPPQPQVVTPPPLVVIPVQQPPVVATTRTPPPPEPVAVVAGPAAVEAAPVASPVVAPRPLGTKAGNVAPSYPTEARRKKWEGTVRLQVVIGLDGRVKDIKVAQSSGHDVLDQAALKAVAKWKFQPAERGGQAVDGGIGIVPIPFVIKD